MLSKSKNFTKPDLSDIWIMDTGWIKKWKIFPRGYTSKYKRPQVCNSKYEVMKRFAVD